MDITFVFDFIITLAVTLVTAFLLPYLKAKYGVENIKSAYEVTKILVNAIEQTTKVTGAGKQKKEWVKERLNDYNLKVDESKVDELIESAVKELNEKVDE